MTTYFREIYEQYAQDVYRYVYWMSGNTAVSEDITSETFARAWAGRDRIRTETVRAYLITIARNLYLKQQDKAKRETEIDYTLESLLPTPERSVENKLMLENIMRHLNTQSEIDRSAFMLRTVYDMPYAEIGRVLNISVSNAKVKIHRVRLKIAQAMEKMEVI